MNLGEDLRVRDIQPFLDGCAIARDTDKTALARKIVHGIFPALLARALPAISHPLIADKNESVSSTAHGDTLSLPICHKAQTYLTTRTARGDDNDILFFSLSGVDARNLDILIPV